MADISLDLTADESEVSIENPLGFDLRIVIGGTSIDLNHEQASAIYELLRPWFDETGASQ